jgi:hypothetical protein
MRHHDNFLAAKLPHPVMKEHTPLSLHDEGARVSFSKYAINDEAIGSRRRLKLHQKIARELHLGVVKSEAYSKEDQEESSGTLTLRKSLEDILKKVKAIQDQAQAISVPLAIGTSDTITVRQRI